MTGIAQSNERVSELLKNLNTESTTLIKPQLIEIVASTLSLSKTEQRPVFNFKVQATLNRPTVEKPADAASAGGKNG